MIFSISIDEIDSTQNLAKELINKGFHDKFKHIVITAKKQSNGRGQRENKWSSEKGGIYFTFTGHIPESNIKKTKDLSVKTAEIIKKILDFRYSINCLIKPPNDVYVKEKGNYKKISGILIETTPRNSKRFIIIGIGINLKNPIPSELKEKAANLYSITKKTYTSKLIIKEIIKKLQELFNELQ